MVTVYATWEQLCENIRLMENITGQKLHHGETDYDASSFFSALANDSTLVARVLVIYGIKAVGNTGENLELAELLTDAAILEATE